MSTEAAVAESTETPIAAMSNSSPPPGTLNRFVDRACGLYSLPGVAMKVLELTRNPQVDAAKLKECIENDPALTTRLLRTVNSSLFGLSREVSDLNQALALLGTKPLKLLVLGFSLPTELFAGVQTEVLESYWKHTLTKAVAGRELSERIWKQAGDDAFIAGLLQDVGMLVLLRDLGEPYARFLAKVHTEEGDLATLEIATLGFDHALLSARLLDHWGLPLGLVGAVAAPLDAEQILAMEEDRRSLPQIIHLAELLAQLLVDDSASALPELLDAGEKYCGLAAEQLDDMVDNVQETVRQLADVLSLSFSDGQAYKDILVAAHARLSEVTFDLVAGDAQRQDESPWPETQSLASAIREFSLRAARPNAPADGVPVAEDTAAASPQTATAVASDDSSADPGLCGRVNQAGAACRQDRTPLSLLLMEVDQYDRVVLEQGSSRAAGLVRLLEATATAMCETDGVTLQTSDARIAIVVENCDRQEAVRQADRLVRGVRQWSQQQVESGGPDIRVSVGVATVAVPQKNFLAADLVDPAQRCLYGAQAGGGDSVKSIEIY